VAANSVFASQVDPQPDNAKNVHLSDTTTSSDVDLPDAEVTGPSGWGRRPTQVVDRGRKKMLGGFIVVAGEPLRWWREGLIAGVLDA
jgi:hypothetical protein